MTSELVQAIKSNPTPTLLSGVNWTPILHGITNVIVSSLGGSPVSFPSGLYLTFSVRYITCRKRLFNLTDTDYKALVVYGSNLSSTVGFSITKKIRMSTGLPSHIEQMITGLLLSNGYLRYGKGCQNASFKFAQSVNNLPYFKPLNSIKIVRTSYWALLSFKLKSSSN